MLWKRVDNGDFSLSGLTKLVFPGAKLVFPGLIGVVAWRLKKISSCAIKVRMKKYRKERNWSQYNQNLKKIA
ncbi:MAG: hypothetical protein P8P83_04035, partial [Rickettsiaceae bacterium]|nr:hypothetical protein [Rickettsiaceae bacterium]